MGACLLTVRQTGELVYVRVTFVYCVECVH